MRETVKTLQLLSQMEETKLLFWLRQYLRHLDPSPIAGGVLLEYPDVAFQQLLAADLSELADRGLAREVEDLIRNRLPSALASLLGEWSLMDGAEYLERLLSVSGVALSVDARGPLLDLLSSTAFEAALHLRPDAKAMVLANLLDVADRTNDETLKKQLINRCREWIVDPHCAALCFREFAESDRDAWLKWLPSLIEAKLAYSDLKLWSVLDTFFNRRPDVLDSGGIGAALERVFMDVRSRAGESRGITALRTFTAQLPLIGIYMQPVPAPVVHRFTQPSRRSEGVHVYLQRARSTEPHCHMRPRDIPTVWPLIKRRQQMDVLCTSAMLASLSGRLMLELLRSRNLQRRVI